jgi:hypothetical protein
MAKLTAVISARVMLSLEIQPPEIILNLLLLLWMLQVEQAHYEEKHELC